ncbi:MAG: hypothetical protein AVDCRST_MAG47-1499, partial [uncultured Nocardioidaceae bacterium]
GAVAGAGAAATAGRFRSGRRVGRHRRGRGARRCGGGCR